jgi:CRISPR type IV-associated protein Csf1
MEYITRASELFPPKEGDMEGKCIICGRFTTKGNKIDFSDNFTNWHLLEEGEVICEQCYNMVRDQNHRRKSWVATREGIEFLKRDQFIPIMLNPPEPPFVIYFTKSGKKQGFLKLIDKVNYSKNKFWVAYEDDLIFVDKNILLEMVELAREARELGFTKGELENGAFTHNWKHRTICEKIEQFKGNSLWRLVVNATK